MDRFYNQGKTGMGFSAMVSGTGFMISRAVLERLGGWNTDTISEDLEMTVQCVLREEKLAWVPGAVTYDEQPLTLAESVKQRRRWVSGTLQVARQYLPRVWGRMRRSPGGEWADQLFTLGIPAYQVVALLSMVLSAAAAGFAGGTGRFVPAACLAALALNLAVTMATTAVTALVTTRLEGKRARKMWKGILLYGVFVLSWLPITVLCMFRRTTEWEQIKHTRNVAAIPARRAVREPA